MTDRECLEQLISKLNLTKIVTKNDVWQLLAPNQFSVRTRDTVFYDLGCGIGNEGLFVSFIFDKDGNIIGHTVYE